MKKILLSVFMLSISFFPHMGFCDATSKSLKIEKLIQLTDYKKIYENQLALLTQQIVTENPIFTEHQSEILRTLSELLEYNDLHQLIQSTFNEYFTEEELEAMIRFNQTPQGKSIQQKMPKIAEATMKYTQASLAHNEDKLDNLLHRIAEQEAKKLQSS